jgi:hypothetical protein
MSIERSFTSKSAPRRPSKDCERLARFYRDVIGIPLEDEQHGETAQHYGCEFGDLHFAIHPLENFKGTGHGTGSVKLAFTVFTQLSDRWFKHLESRRAKGHDVLVQWKASR